MLWTSSTTLIRFKQHNVYVCFVDTHTVKNFINRKQKQKKKSLSFSSGKKIYRFWQEL